RLFRSALWWSSADGAARTARHVFTIRLQSFILAWHGVGGDARRGLLESTQPRGGRRTGCPRCSPFVVVVGSGSGQVGAVDDVATAAVPPPQAARPAGASRTPRRVREVPGPIDRWFNRLTLTAGLLVMALLTLVGVFLLLRARTALSESG